MNNDNEIVKNLVAGGIIGAALGALIADDNQEGATIGAIAGAVIFATLKANDKAKQTHIPFFIEEENSLYKIDSDGSKHFVKKIEKSQTKLNKQFILK
jgi:outer membrane lipoprotein SlyB